MRTTPVLFCLALLVACDGPTEAGPAAATPAARAEPTSVVLAWTVSHPRWGEESLLVENGGHVRYSLEAPSAAAVRSELDIPTREVDELRERFDAAHTCALASARDEGEEDESRPSIQLRFPGLECSVSMWWGEWRTREDARATSDLVVALRERMRRAALAPASL